MELSPQSVASTTFKTVKKGYDPDEVRAYLAQLATAIESAQSQASAMEARARAAVARLQEIAAQPSAAAASASNTPTGIAKPGVVAPTVGVEESETISRTLLLAQRTADNTVAEADADAARIRSEAEAEAKHALETARETQTRLIEEAKVEARQAGEGARVQVESEVQALLARREFLLSDVDHLEQHVITHRERLRNVSTALNDLVESVPGGLGDLRRPLMSAVTDEAPEIEQDATMPMTRVDRATMADGAPDAFASSDSIGDFTPAFGGELPFDNQVTGGVPVTTDPQSDAFPSGGPDRR
ncbi:MAG: hypothetical protein JWN62_149 [Acidimicrobiales bacterium]|nr:hypothetical protein [Acidimicrobiales bacterium]